MTRDQLARDPGSWIHGPDVVVPAQQAGPLLRFLVPALRDAVAASGWTLVIPGAVVAFLEALNAVDVAREHGSMSAIGPVTVAPVSVEDVRESTRGCRRRGWFERPPRAPAVPRRTGRVPPVRCPLDVGRHGQSAHLPTRPGPMTDDTTEAKAAADLASLLPADHPLARLGRLRLDAAVRRQQNQENAMQLDSYDHTHAPDGHQLQIAGHLDGSEPACPDCGRHLGGPRHTYAHAIDCPAYAPHPNSIAAQSAQGA